MMTERRQAVVDLGSNSFRLVVFTWREDGRASWWKRTDEVHEAVRIGEGLDSSGALPPQPMGGARASPGGPPRGADGAGAADARALRPLLPRDGDRRRAAGRDVGDPRR